MTQPSQQSVQTQVAAQPQRVAAGAGLGMGRLGQSPAQPPAPAKPGLGKKLALAAVVIAVGAAVIIKSVTDPASTAVHAPQVQTQVQAETQAVATTGWQPAVPAGAWREESRAGDPTAPLLGFVATSGDSMVQQQVIGDDGSSLRAVEAMQRGWRILALNPQGSGHALGLRVGDLMTSYRGTPLSGSSPDVVNSYHKTIEHALEPVTVTIVRDGATLTLTGPLGYASSRGALTP